VILIAIFIWAQLEHGILVHEEKEIQVRTFESQYFINYPLITSLAFL